MLVVHEFFAEQNKIYCFVIIVEGFTMFVDHKSAVKAYEILGSNTCEDYTVTSTSILPYINHRGTAGERYDLNLFDKLRGGVAIFRSIWYFLVRKRKLTAILYTNSLSGNT